MNSNHIELEVEFRVVSNISFPVNTPSRRALLLLPSKACKEGRAGSHTHMLKRMHIHLGRMQIPTPPHFEHVILLQSEISSS